MTHKWGRTATYPKLGDSQLSFQEERPHEETPHSMRVYVPSNPNPNLGHMDRWPRQCLPKHMQERLKRHLT